MLRDREREGNRAGRGEAYLLWKLENSLTVRVITTWSEVHLYSTKD